jgi:mycothiol synthase
MGIELRKLRSSDAEQVAELFVRSFGESRPMDAEEIRSWLHNKEVKPEWLRVLESDGRVIGYGDITIQENEVALDAAAPGHWGPFLDWAEESARAHEKSRVRAYVPTDHELAAVVESRGYRVWRSTYSMEIDLENPPPPVLPEGISLRPFERKDERTLRTTINEVFVEDPFHNHLTVSRFREFYLRARGFDPSLWLLAWDGDDLVGFALSFPERSGNKELGWIGDLGVRAPWRKRGLGEALLRAAFHALHERGLRRAGLGVDIENETGALRLYERVGMRPVWRSDNWILELPAAGS